MGKASPTISFSGAGLLQLGGALWAGGGGTLTAASGSTVQYNGAAQTVAAFAYTNLTFSGSGARTLQAGTTTIGGNLSIASGVTATLASGTTVSVSGLYLNSVQQVPNTWGGTGSGAVNINTTYFNASTGKLNVTSGASATRLIVTLPGQTFTAGAGNGGTVSAQTAGTAFNITLTAVDANNWVDASYTGSKGVSYSGPGNAPSGGATPTYTSPVTFTAGQAASVATKLVKAETPTITAAISGLSGVASSSLTVNAGTATVLSIETAANGSGSVVGTQNITAGNSLTVYSIARDAYGNPTNPSVTWSLANITGGVAGSDLAPTSGASSTFTAHLIGSANIHAALASPALTADSGTLTVVLGPIAGYSVTAATPQTRATAFNVTVTAVDAGGNPVTTDTSTAVTMTSSTGNVLFDANGDSTFNDNTKTLTSGTLTIAAKDNYFETVTITATDPNSKTGTSSSIVVNPLNGDYQSRATGNWGTYTTWSIWNGSAWANAGSTAAPTSSTTNLISVTNTTVTVAASVTASNLLIIAGGTLSISNGVTFTVNHGLANGVISGAGILAESGSGNVLTLNGNNTYSGGTTITAGTVAVTNVTTSGTVQLGTNGITFASGGTLLNTGPGAQTTSRAITLNSGGGVISMSGNTMYLTGTISGGGGLTSSGSDLILNPSAANNIGTMTVNGGRLFVFNANAIANSAVLHINNGATLDFNVTGGISPANTMTFASGSCLANRVGTLTVTTANVTFPASGTMIFNSDDQNTTAITVSGNYPALAGPLAIQVGPTGSSTVGNVTLSGAISGTGGLTKTSTGTLVLGSANSYTGGTTVNGGSLTANVSNSLGASSGALSLASGATVTLTSSTSDTVSTLYLAGAPQVSGTWGGTGSSAGNKNGTYFGTTATGLLTVSAVPTSTGLTSSSNPALPGAGVSFTATVSPLAGSGTPSGTVLFKNNGVALGSAVTLSGGSASSDSISTLPHGNNAITAEYSGGTGFLASTGTVMQVINTPPAAGAHNLVTKENVPLSVGIGALPSRDYDADHDSLVMTAVAQPFHGTVTTNATQLTYSPTSGYAGPDSFTYVVSDGFLGGTNTSTVNVTVQATTQPSTNNLASISYPGGTTIILQGYGIPTTNYDVLMSTNADFSYPTNVATVTAAANSILLYTNTAAPSPSFWQFAVP